MSLLPLQHYNSKAVDFKMFKHDLVIRNCSVRPFVASSDTSELMTKISLI